ncbi:MAG TPA: glycosyltransferase [Thermoleophilaceae bacterium]
MSGLVSVIVPTRNSADTIGPCLESIRRQTHPEVELIVVDNSSSDGTKQIAARFADAVLDKGPERSAQRNAGASVASGAHLMFIDSDMNLEQGVVAECVELADEGHAAVVIPETSFGSGYWARCKALERSCYLGDETIEAARFFTRDTFEAVGGYDESIPYGPEDWDIHARVRASGGRVGRTRSMIHHDEGRLGLGETVATKYYYGKATEQYIRKHGALARQQLTVLRPAFFRQWRRLASDPVAAAGMLFMKACELAAGAAGLIAARLRSSG